MKKLLVERFFGWWMSIHQMNVYIFEDWMSVFQIKAQPQKTSHNSVG